MRPRFTVTELFAAMTLIIVGIGAVAAMPKLQHMPAAPWINVLLWFGGGACVGAGVCMPFKRKLLGVAVAVAAQIVFLFWDFG